MKEVFWPFLYHFSEGNKIKEGGVNIYKGIRAFKVGIEVLNLIHHIVFNVFPHLGTILESGEVEQIGSWGIFSFENT